MSSQVNALLRAGSLLRESGGVGRARLAGFVEDKSGKVFGLTTNLVFGGEDLSLLADKRTLHSMDPPPVSSKTISAIACLSRVDLGRGARLVAPAQAHESAPEILTPFAALGSRVRVVRHPQLVTYGRVVGANCAVTLRNRSNGSEQIYVDVLAIEPDMDGAVFANRGDAGAMLLSPDGCAVGLLIGRAESIYYVAPLDTFLRQHELQLSRSTEVFLPTIANTRRAPLETRLAEIALQFRTIDAATKEAESLGARIGTEMAAEQSHLRSVEAKEESFRSIWPAFKVDGGAEDIGDRARAAHNQRVARAEILRSWRSRIVHPLPASPDDKARILEENLHLQDGVWGGPLRLIEQIEGEFRAMMAEGLWRNSHDRLIVAHSDYHEERILAELISMLSFAQHGKSRFELAPSRWRFGRQLNEPRKRFNTEQGGADIRLVNVIAGRPKADESLADDRPIFQHYGYTAYSRRGWLRSVAEKVATPPAVTEWIHGAIEGHRSDLNTRATLPIRAWLVAHSKPLNYRGTEFPPLFKYIWDLGRQVGSLRQPPEFSEKPTDEAFHEFIVRPGRVFMSGSIYDLLIDEWFSVGDDIVTLLEANDFHELRVNQSGNLGKNALLFSKRVAQHPRLERLIVELYQTVWTTLLSRLDDTSRGDGVFRYLSSLLAPISNGQPSWTFAASSDAIQRLMTVEVRPVPVESLAPDRTVISFPKAAG